MEWMQVFFVFIFLLINRGQATNTSLRKKKTKAKQTNPSPTVPKGTRYIQSPTTTPVKFISAPPKGIYTSFPSSAPSFDSGEQLGKDSALGRSATKQKMQTNAQLDTSLPKMEVIPQTLQAPPITDAVDVPNTVDGAMASDAASSTSEIPPMERIPDNIDSYHNAQPRDIVDDAPIILPFGGQAEDYVLHQVASVCAISEQDAFMRCQQTPVCKYVVSSTGRITSEFKTGQGQCIHRCDYPLGVSQCESHEQCFHFVLSCKVNGWS
jgi:hypothetical protein